MDNKECREIRARIKGEPEHRLIDELLDLPERLSADEDAEEVFMDAVETIVFLRERIRALEAESEGVADSTQTARRNASDSTHERPVISDAEIDNHVDGLAESDEYRYGFEAGARWVRDNA